MNQLGLPQDLGEDLQELEKKAIFLIVTAEVEDTVMALNIVGALVGTVTCHNRYISAFDLHSLLN